MKTTDAATQDRIAQVLSDVQKQSTSSAPTHNVWDLNPNYTHHRIVLFRIAYHHRVSPLRVHRHIVHPLKILQRLLLLSFSHKHRLSRCSRPSSLPCSCRLPNDSAMIHAHHRSRSTFSALNRRIIAIGWCCKRSCVSNRWDRMNPTKANRKTMKKTPKRSHWTWVSNYLSIRRRPRNPPRRLERTRALWGLYKNKTWPNTIISIQWNWSKRSKIFSVDIAFLNDISARRFSVSLKEVLGKRTKRSVSASPWCSLVISWHDRNRGNCWLRKVANHFFECNCFSMIPMRTISYCKHCLPLCQSRVH